VNKRFFIFFIIVWTAGASFFALSGFAGGDTYGGIILSAFMFKKDLIEFVGAEEYEYYRFAIDEKSYAEIIRLPKEKTNDADGENIGYKIKTNGAGGKSFGYKIKTDGAGVENIGYKIKTNCAGGESFENIVKKLRILTVKRESFSGIETVYGYALGLSGLYNMNGKFINIQIADNGTYILIGSPYIPDGF
jgi:hypothetical protein